MSSPYLPIIILMLAAVGFALAPLALAWLLRPRQSGFGHAAAGGALLAGLVATPATSLAFFAWLAALQLPRFVLPWREKLAGGGQAA